MYTVYFNHKTNTHSIVNDNLSHLIEEDDVLIQQGSLNKCKEYLSLLGVMFQTIDESLPSECEGAE